RLSVGYQHHQDRHVQAPQEAALMRLQWYDRLLEEAPQCEASCLNWKAWANCGVCLYHLGEKKASWDAYAQAANALEGFRVELTDDAFLRNPHVGKYMRVLDREFHEGSWHWEEANDVVLFALLVQRGRAGEVCTQRWHERLPNHYFAVMHVLCMQLSKPDRPLQEVCPDDSR
ncbi:Hypothetical protein (Fragment), partial [Durusdinium trenchii]